MTTPWGANKDKYGREDGAPEERAAAALGDIVIGIVMAVVVAIVFLGPIALLHYHFGLAWSEASFAIVLGSTLLVGTIFLLGILGQQVRLFVEGRSDKFGKS